MTNVTSVNWHEGRCDYCDCLSEHLVYSDTLDMICIECVIDHANEHMHDVTMRWNAVEEKVELVEKPVKERIANVYQ
jgi:hypothetical protein